MRPHPHDLKPVPARGMLPWIGLFLVFLAGAGLLWLGTRKGAGTSPDSAVYVGVANEVVAGNGWRVPFGDVPHQPLTQFPPLYPALLALPGLVGFDPFTAARWVQILLYLANLSVIFMLLRGMDGHSAWRALAGTAILAFSPSFLHTHQMIWSEGLFLLLTLTALSCLMLYFKTGRLAWLVSCGVALGVALLTRYAALAVLGGMALALLWLGRDRPRQRLGHALILLLSAAWMPALWLLRNLLTAGEATGRSLSLHWIGMAQGYQAMNSMAGWLLLRDDLPRWAAALTALLLVAVPVLLILRAPSARRDLQRAALPLTLTLLMAAYALFLILSISLIDANTPLDDRLLLPEWVLGVLLMLRLFWRPAMPARRGQAWIALALAVWGAAALYGGATWAWQLAQNGNNYTQAPWRMAEAIDIIQPLSADALVYSNAPEVLYLQTRHAVWRLPKKVELMSQTENPALAQDLQTVADRLRDDQGMVVYFTRVQGRTILSEQELLQAIPALQPVIRTEVGHIYRIDGSVP